MADMVQATQPPLRDTGDVPEIFADDFLGLTVIGLNFKLTFTSIQADQAADPVRHHRQVSARLVLPVEAAVSLRDSLGQALAQLKGRTTPTTLQ